MLLEEPCHSTLEYHWQWFLKYLNWPLIGLSIYSCTARENGTNLPVWLNSRLQQHKMAVAIIIVFKFSRTGQVLKTMSVSL